MKQIRKFSVYILLLVISVFSALTIGSCSKELYKYEERDAGYLIAAANTNISGDITIPLEYNNKPVLGLNVYAFENCTNIKNLTIPEGITIINPFSFKNCHPSMIYIPVSLNGIGVDAFPDNSSYKITYNGTKAQWKKIVGYTFATIGNEVNCTDGKFTSSDM